MKQKHSWEITGEFWAVAQPLINSGLLNRAHVLRGLPRII